MAPPLFPSLTFPQTPYSSPLPIVALAPGGAKNILADDALRRWPIESYASLAKKLSALPIQLVLTGGASDEWIRKYFADIPHVDLIGKLDLLQLASLFKECRLLITHDSGPLHLSKLAACPAIGLFGPTMPAEKVGANEKIKVLWGGERLACRPCYDGKTYAPCKNNLCLASISPEKVFEEAERILNLASSFTC